VANSKSYALTYAGQPLSLPSGLPDSARAALARFRYLPELRDQVTFPFRPGGRLRTIAFPRYPDLPELSLNSFFYPTGASRWAIGRFLATKTAVASMETVALPSGANPVASAFVMQADDLVHKSTDALSAGGITTNLFMLPSRPLGITASKGALDGFLLVTLVDARYYWQFAPAGIIDSASLTSWTALIASLATALGVTISVPLIAAAYGSPEPDSDLWSNNENAALLLDAVLWNVGLTLVRTFDGTFSAVRTATGDATITANRPAAPRCRVFGGNILDPSEAGTASPARMNAVLPQSFKVTFPSWQTNVGYIDPVRSGYFTKDSYGQVWTETVLLSALGAPYSSYTGFVGSKEFHTTAKALFSNSVGSGTPTNAVAITALAQQLAKDYCDAQLEGLDETYAGIRNWAPDPTNDVTWHFGGECAADTVSGRIGEVFTRIQRKPWNWEVREFQHSFGLQSITACPGTVLFETDVRCEGGNINVYRRDVTLGIINDCLQVAATTEWYFYAQQGCCLCPGQSSITSSIPGSSSMTIVVDCCAGIDLPYVLCGTFSTSPSVSATFNFGTNGFSCAGGAWAPDGWSSGIVVFTYVQDSQSRSFYVFCLSGVWYLVVCSAGEFIPSVIPATSASCNPFQIVFTISNDPYGFWPTPVTLTLVPGSCASSSGSGGISRSALGTATNYGAGVGNTLNATLSVAGGALLVVETAIAVTSTGLGSLVPTLEYNGVFMTGFINSESTGQVAGHNDGVRTDIWYLYVAADTSNAPLVFKTNASNGGLALCAVEVLGLANNAPDTPATAAANDAGTPSKPDTGASPTTAIAHEYVQAACVAETSNTSFGYVAPFAKGQQVLLQGPDGNTFILSEGFDILSSVGTPEAKLDTSYNQWAACEGAFK